MGTFCFRPFITVNLTALIPFVWWRLLVFEVCVGNTNAFKYERPCARPGHFNSIANIAGNGNFEGLKATRIWISSAPYEVILVLIGILTRVSCVAELLHRGDLSSSMESLSYDVGVPSPGSLSAQSQQRTKRMRTSFKHHQLRTMKSYFAINQNPDAKDLKQLAQKTGLSKRVLQVREASPDSWPLKARDFGNRPKVWEC